MEVAIDVHPGAVTVTVTAKPGGDPGDGDDRKAPEEPVVSNGDEASRSSKKRPLEDVPSDSDEDGLFDVLDSSQCPHCERGYYYVMPTQNARRIRNERSRSTMVHDPFDRRVVVACSNCGDSDDIRSDALTDWRKSKKK